MELVDRIVDQHAETDDGCSEHACTVLLHECGCHGADMSGQLPLQLATRTMLSTVGTSLATPPIVLGRNGDPPALRPPI